jgi:orsellinic acid C2-O-methyltransferase
MHTLLSQRVTSTPRAFTRFCLKAALIEQSLSVLCHLNVPALLRDGPIHIDELARRTASHSDNLLRLLRALVSLDFLGEPAPDTFALTPFSECLDPEHPETLAPPAALAVHEWAWRPMGALLHAIRHGGTPFEHVFGTDLFAYLAQHPEEHRAFQRGMSGNDDLCNDVVSSYDFSKASHIVDVGGGHGSVLLAVLSRFPTLSGVIYDLPSSSEGAMTAIRNASLDARCTWQPGSFFESIPSGDLHLLRYILHDWDDERCVAILRRSRESISPNGTLLVVDQLLTEERSGNTLDLTMLIMTGGRERTLEEFRTIFNAASFTLDRVIPLRRGFAILVGVSNVSDESHGAQRNR